MTKQYLIFPVGWLKNVEVNVAGVKSNIDIEVIEIIAEKDPYPAY